MLRRAAIPVLALLAHAFIAAPSAHGELQPEKMSLTPFIGGYTFDGDQDLKKGTVFGLRAGYSLDRNWDVEGVLDYVSTEAKSGAGDASSYSYRVDGLYNILPGQRFIPFLAAGLGGNTVDYPDGSGKGTKTKATFNYGGGIKYLLSDAWALRGDIRHVLVFEKLSRAFGNLEYTFGFNYFFGKTVEPVAPADTDGDGVMDDIDRCPGTRKGVAVDSMGCPVDTDGDGVVDDIDKCPGTPRGVAVDSMGCPVDTDGDGVVDYLDKCPGTPRGVAVDSMGCPPVLEEKVMRLNIEFDTDKAEIKPVYFDEIKKVADVMAAYPDITVEIAGHTDNVGSARYNNALSLRRAQSVKAYLVEKFSVAPGRLTASGYGPSRPVADNATSEGRQRNRRIEAVINYTVVK